MYHRIAYFDTGRVAVDQQAPRLALQNRHQRSKALEVFRLGNEGSGQLPVQGLQSAAQFGFVGHFDHHRGRPENLLLK